jgi:hypothetical protein
LTFATSTLLTSPADQTPTSNKQRRDSPEKTEFRYLANQLLSAIQNLSSTTATNTENGHVSSIEIAQRDDFLYADDDLFLDPSVESMLSQYDKATRRDEKHQPSDPFDSASPLAPSMLRLNHCPPSQYDYSPTRIRQPPAMNDSLTRQPSTKDSLTHLSSMEDSLSHAPAVTDSPTRFRKTAPAIHHNISDERLPFRNLQTDRMESHIHANATSSPRPPSFVNPSVPHTRGMNAECRMAPSLLVDSQSTVQNSHTRRGPFQFPMQMQQPNGGCHSASRQTESVADNGLLDQRLLNKNSRNELNQQNRNTRNQRNVQNTGIHHNMCPRDLLHHGNQHNSTMQNEQKQRQTIMQDEQHQMNALKQPRTDRHSTTQYPHHRIHPSIPTSQTHIQTHGQTFSQQHGQCETPVFDGDDLIADDDIEITPELEMLLSQYDRPR